MSLLSFVELPDVRVKLRQVFEKPKLPNIQGKLTCLRPLTNNHQLIGTAFDYLLRFYLKHVNPRAISSPWVAAKAVEFIRTTPMLDRQVDRFRGAPVLHVVENRKYLARRASVLLEAAQEQYEKFLRSGIFTDALVKSALCLAQLDNIYRAGFIVDKKLGAASKKDVRDLQALIGRLDPTMFRARSLCLLNPTFSPAAQLVGGADADLVVDDLLVDIKTTKYLRFDRRYFDQLAGYYTLYRIGGIDGLPNKRKIRRLGIYFARYGYLCEISVSDIIDEARFTKFAKWLETRATRKSGEWGR